MREVFACLILVTASPVWAAGAEISVRTELTPPVIPFHAQARLSVIVEAPSGLDIQMPDVKEAIAPLEVYGTPELLTEPIGDNRTRITETFTLEAIHPRLYPLRPVRVEYGDGTGITVPLPALSVRELTEPELEAAAVFEETLAQLPPEAPRWWERWGWLVLAAGVLGLIALVALRRREKVTPEPEPARKAPWDLALDRLRTLEQRRLPEAGRYETYYVDLSAILRYYIEGRFQLHAPEQTTPEFLAESMGKGTFTQEQERFLAGFLRHGDLVKFARLVPAETAMKDDFLHVRQFVMDTIPARTGTTQAEAA